MESLKLVINYLLGESLIRLFLLIVFVYIISLMLKMLLTLYRPFHFLFCPKCESEISRTKRNFLVKIITNLLGIRPYYCNNCQWKGWKLSPELLQKLHQKND